MWYKKQQQLSWTFVWHYLYINLFLFKCQQKYAYWHLIAKRSSYIKFAINKTKVVKLIKKCPTYSFTCQVFVNIHKSQNPHGNQPVAMTIPARSVHSFPTIGLPFRGSLEYFSRQSLATSSAKAWSNLFVDMMSVINKAYN